MKRAQPIPKTAPIPLKGLDLSLRQERQHVDGEPARLHLRRLPQRQGAGTPGLGRHARGRGWRPHRSHQLQESATEEEASKQCT